MDLTAEVLDRFNGNQLYHAVGIRVLEAAGGRASTRLIPAPELCWPFEGQPHGGILFTQMDTTAAWAVLSVADPGRNCTTIHLDIQYTAPARKGPFLCRARVNHRTSRICFVQAETADNTGQVVALGQGTFRIIKDSGAPVPEENKGD